MSNNWESLHPCYKILTFSNSQSSLDLLAAVVDMELEGASRKCKHIDTYDDDALPL